jgi:YVTN family beta-propeller protein
MIIKEKIWKKIVGINFCIQASRQLACVFLSVGTLSLATPPVQALPKDTVFATISTGNVYVGDVVVSPDGNYLYGANNDNKTVMVIDTGTNEVTSTISVGNLPRGIAISPDGGTLYVSNAQDGTVSVIATATGTVTTTVAVGDYPFYLAVSPDGSYVYVPNANDATVSIIDTSSDQVVATVAVPHSASEAGFSQSGLNAYVSTGSAAKHGGSLTVFRTSNQKIKSTIDLEGGDNIGYWFAVNPQGKEMYLVERARVVLFDTVTNAIKGGAIKTPKIAYWGSETAAVTPDGHYLYEPFG